MLFLCYPVLVSLALAAPGISRNCFDYCKTQLSDQTKDASLECDCADFIHTEIDSDESSMIILDDTGVYFVPAETQTFQEQFSSRPFLISNPAKLLPKTKHRINREFITIKEPSNDRVPSQSAHIEIYEKTETISHTSITEDLKNSPLYLDLDIQESTDKNRESLEKQTLIEDFESTERDLVECLDFQVVHLTRKYGFNVKFRNYWTARSLDKYEHWSDLDIEENIKKWCSKPESIVKHSLQEIKQGLPQKTPDENKNQFSSTENSTILVTTTSLSNETERSATYNKSTEDSLKHNITEIYDTTNDPTEDCPLPTVTSLSTLKEANLYETQNSSYPVDAVSDATAITTLNPLIRETPSDTTIHVNQPIKITASDSDTDLDTMASEDVFYPYVPTVMEAKSVDDAHQFHNKTTRLHNPTTPSSTDESQEGQSAVTDVTTLDGQTLYEINTKSYSYDTSQISVTEAYPEQREKYEEKDIRIPKIITKECHNNKILTKIDGFEKLPNDDYKDSISQTDVFENGKGDIKLDITGRLYLISKQQLVPVHFVQTNDGDISLGVDGPALCDKLVLNTTKKSQLLNVLCEYVQSNMYLNRNSSMIPK